MSEITDGLYTRLQKAQQATVAITTYLEKNRYDGESWACSLWIDEVSNLALHLQVRSGIKSVSKMVQLNLYISELVDLALHTAKDALQELRD